MVPSQSETNARTQMVDLTVFPTWGLYEIRYSAVLLFKLSILKLAKNPVFYYIIVFFSFSLI